MKKESTTIKFCMIALFSLFLGVDSNAQTAKKTDGSGTPIYQPAVNTQGRSQIQQSSSAVNNGPVYVLNEDDIYQGRKEEILGVLAISSIPNDFPKYQKGKGIQWYNDQIDVYYRLHPEVLKDMYRKKLGI